MFKRTCNVTSTIRRGYESKKIKTEEEEVEKNSVCSLVGGALGLCLLACRGHYLAL
jgi:hypothetical protein